MRRTRSFSVLSAILAVCLSLVAPVAAAPTAPPTVSATIASFEFSVPEHWRAVDSQEHGSVTVTSFLLDKKGSRAIIVHGTFGFSADALASRNVSAATAEGFGVVGTLRSPDRSFVSVRLRRVHKDTSVVDEAVIAVRMSHDAPHSGILTIGQWGIEHGNSYASQMLDVLREAKMAKAR